MRSSNTKQFKDQPYSFAKKFVAYTLCAFLPVALIHLYFYPFSLSPTDQLSSNNRIVVPSPPPPISQGMLTYSVIHVNFGILKHLCFHYVFYRSSWSQVRRVEGSGC